MVNESETSKKLIKHKSWFGYVGLFILNVLPYFFLLFFEETSRPDNVLTNSTYSSPIKLKEFKFNSDDSIFAIGVCLISSILFIEKHEFSLSGIGFLHVLYYSFRFVNIYLLGNVYEHVLNALRILYMTFVVFSFTIEIAKLKDFNFSTVICWSINQANAAIDFGYLLYSSNKGNFWIDLFHLFIKLYCLWNIYQVHDLANRNEEVPRRNVTQTNNLGNNVEQHELDSMQPSTSATRTNSPKNNQRNNVEKTKLDSMQPSTSGRQAKNSSTKDSSTNNLGNNAEREPLQPSTSTSQTNDERPENPDNNGNEQKRLTLIKTLLASFLMIHTGILSPFFSPINPLRNALIHSNDPYQNSMAMSNLAMCYGFILPVFAIFVKFLRSKCFVKRLHIVNTTRFAHLLICIFISINFDQISFEGLAMNNDKAEWAYFSYCLIIMCMVGYSSQVLDYFIKELRGRVEKQNIVLWMFSNIILWAASRGVQATTTFQQICFLVVLDLLAMIVFWKLEAMSNPKKHDESVDEEDSNEWNEFCFFIGACFKKCPNFCAPIEIISTPELEPRTFPANLNPVNHVQ